MPYWRLSGFYLFYFAALGALIPYWGLYLQSLGFNAAQIGNLMGLLLLSRIIAPTVWGVLADRYHGRRMRLVRSAALVAAMSYTGVFFVADFWGMAAVMMTFTFFWHAALPQLEATTLTAHGHGYGKVRLWGSIGFIAMVLALGPALDRFGTWWLLPTLLAALVGIWVFTVLVPEIGHEPALTEASFVKTLVRPPVLIFLLACALMQASHGPYYTFYSIYLHDNGYSKTLIGALWALAVLCEIGVFWWMVQLLRRVRLRQLFLASLVLAALRWLLIGYGADSTGLLVFAQMLHAATFGIYHASAVQLVHRFFVDRHQIRGQALFGSVSGVGAAIGSVYSGYAWQQWGAATTFALGAAIALAAFALVWRSLRPRT